MKIELQYDPATGAIETEEGGLITHWPGLENHQSITGTTELKSEPMSNIDDLVKLRDAGFTDEEIIAMSSRGVI
jgi:hypothetical protein